MESTAKYPNRVADKKMVENLWDLPEFPEADYKPRIYVRTSDRKDQPMLLAIGYERIVYGDHGPYLEFRRAQVQAFLKYHGDGNRFIEATCNRSVDFYYYWLDTEPRSIKVYYQLKSVKRLANAPARPDGKPSKFNRSEGYADYKPGFFYVSVFDIWAISPREDYNGQGD